MPFALYVINMIPTAKYLLESTRQDQVENRQGHDIRSAVKNTLEEHGRIMDVHQEGCAVLNEILPPKELSTGKDQYINGSIWRICG